MSEIFPPVVQGWITRRSKNKLNLPFGKTNMGQNGLSYIGPKIWNSLQSGLKSSNNVNSFKHKIKDKFFNDLQNRENSPYAYYQISKSFTEISEFNSWHFSLTDM